MGSSRSDAVIAFIDLAGFSASTDVYGDQVALAMLARFEKKHSATSAASFTS